LAILCELASVCQPLATLIICLSLALGLMIFWI
jgi:hypothetical protein